MCLIESDNSPGLKSGVKYYGRGWTVVATLGGDEGALSQLPLIVPR